MIDDTHELVCQQCLKQIGTWLSKREYSTQQLRHKLLARGLDASIIDEALQLATEKGWLSDLRFAKAFVHDAMLRYQGPLRIRQQLEGHGVDHGIITEVLPEDADVWLKLARLCYSKRYGQAASQSMIDAARLPIEQAKQMRYLRQRGFPAVIARQVVSCKGSDQWIEDDE